MSEIIKFRNEVLAMALARPRMKYSTLWLLVLLGIALSGHPMTGALFGFPWYAHRRWERTIRQKVTGSYGTRKLQ